MNLLLPSQTNALVRRLWLCAGLLATLLCPGHARAEMLRQDAPVDELISALESDDNNLWGQSTTFLAMRGAAAKPAVPALILALDNPHKRASALYAINGIGPAAVEAVPVLIRGIASWTDQRWPAAAALAAIGPAAVPALKEAAAGNHPVGAIWAHAALAKQSGAAGNSEPVTEHLTFLARQLRNPFRPASQEALRAIQMTGPVAAPLIPDLQAAQRDGLITVQDLVMSLHDIGPAGDIIESILPAFDSRDEFTRMRGAQTLAQIGSPRDKAALPALFAMFESPGPGPYAETMRSAALDALGRIAPNEARLRPLLLKLANDPASRLNQTATTFLLFRQRPIDDEMIAFFIDYVRAHVKHLESLHEQGGIPLVDTDGFLALLTPANRGSAPRFEALARDFAGQSGIMRIAYRALDRIDALKAEHVMPLATSLQSDFVRGYWAVDPLLHLGPRAAVAVPTMIGLLDRPAPIPGVAARILAAIGRPAAEPAIAFLTPLAANGPRPNSSADYSICACLLVLVPGSPVALDGLERLLAANIAKHEIPPSHFLLLTHHRDPERHRVALQELLQGPDERLVAVTAELLMKPEAPPEMRRMAIEHIIALQNSPTGDLWNKEVSARGLESLSAKDRDCEDSLVAAARQQWDNVRLSAQTGPRIPLYYGAGVRQLISIARGLKNLQPKTPEGRALLTEMRQSDIPTLLEVVGGNQSAAD